MNLMVRKLAYFLLALALLAAIGELAGLLLPTLSWPFSAARDLPLLNWEVTSPDGDSALTPQGRFLWFGWLCVLLAALIGVWIVTRPRTSFHLTPLTARRIARFRSIGRGYWSLWIFLVLVACCAMDQALVGKKALIVVHDAQVSFPAFERSIRYGREFGQQGDGADSEADYRKLKRDAGKPGAPSLVIMPPVAYDPTGDSSGIGTEQLELRADGRVYREGADPPYSGLGYRLHDDNGDTWHIRYKFRQGLPDKRVTGMLPDRTEVYTAVYDEGHLLSEQYTGPGTKEQFLAMTPAERLFITYYHPSPPLRSGHLLGTNTQGADIVAYLYGGLQVNIKAALFYLPVVYLIGIAFGMLMGYFGGRFDLVVQRLIEILSQVPFLFIIMIISDMVPLAFKGMFLILGLLIMFGWMGMTYQLRTSTMKEKARDYVSAARVMGASTPRILFVHILPNLIAILVTLVPFSVSALILALASLDYLGFGLPDSYASWGRLLNDGLSNLSSPWVVTSAFTALVVTLLLVTFIGEAIREAFDPKKFTTYK